MSLTSILSSKSIKITFLSVIVLVIGVLLQKPVSSFLNFLQGYSGQATSTSTKGNLFSFEQLSRYNGVDNESLYLAILGVVFDVSSGSQHYGKGSSYNYFVGKDASRSFITGNFADESLDKDHVMDLSCNELDGLINWRNTFRNKYKSKGKLIGRFFDEDGSPTKYSEELKNKLKQCKVEKQLEEEAKQLYPPCNMEWSVGEGTKVWCSNNSGGKTRNWVGVPRQQFTPGQEKPRCVCVNLKEDHSAALLKEYDDCSAAAISCVVKETE